MEVKDYVASLQHSKMIAPYWKGECLFWWVWRDESKQFEIVRDFDYYDITQFEKRFPALTTMELLLALPEFDDEVFEVIAEMFSYIKAVNDPQFVRLVCENPNCLVRLYCRLIKEGRECHKT